MFYSCHKTSRYAGIALFAALSIPCLAFAQSGTTDSALCLHAALCTQAPVELAFESVRPENHNLGRTIARLEGAEPVYFIKAEPIAAKKSAQMHWFDLVQTMRRKRALERVSVMEEGRYPLDDDGGKGQYRLIEWKSGNQTRQALYHLLQIDNRDFWVIVTGVGDLADRIPETIRLLKPVELTHNGSPHQ